MPYAVDLRLEESTKHCNGANLYPLPREVWRTEAHENGRDAVLIVEYPDNTFLRTMNSIYYLKSFTLAHPPFAPRLLRALKSWCFLAFMVLRAKMSCDTLRGAVRCGEYVHPILFRHQTPRFLVSYRARRQVRHESRAVSSVHTRLYRVEGQQVDS